MPEISLIDPALKNYYEHTEISIQVSLGGFSFCITTPEDGLIRAMRHYAFTDTILQEDILNKTEEVLHKDELLRLPHRKVRVCYLSRKSTIVPGDFGDPNAFKKILEFNQPIDDLDEIHYNEIPSCGANLIFAVPTYVAGLLADRFENICFIKSKSGSGSELELISILLNKEFFDIVIIREGKLKLYNSFLYANSTDLLYFILYACRQLDMNVKKTAVLMLGEEAGNQDLIRELRPYLKKQLELNDPGKVRFSLSMEKPDIIRFFTLLNLSHCES
jgi:hypothetical protein